MDSRNPLAPQPEEWGGQTSHCDPPPKPWPGDTKPPGGGGAAPTVDQLPGTEAKEGAKGGACLPLMPSPSPNGGKSLKCPQCNWHYKYPRTRDAHMRQKHPGVGGVACAHCQEGRPHPRLARGQNYTCGYRPFSCRVCDYSTMTKGNLGIHMQSEKHLANVRGLGAGSAHPGPGEPGDSAASVRPPSDARRCKACEREAPGIALGLRTLPTARLEIHRQRHMEQGAGRRGDATILHDGPLLHTGTRGHGGSGGTNGSSEDLVTEEGCLGRGTELDEGSIAPHESSAQLFECLVCQAFGTESLAPLLRHLSSRCRPPEEEWKGLGVERRHCTLCPYRTQLKANFQLHLRTEKPSQDYQLDAHLASAGYPLRPDSLNVRCNLCCFSTTSWEQLYLHVSGPSHQENLRLYTHLQHLDRDTTTEQPRNACKPCGFETTTKLSLMDHTRTETHQDMRAQWELRNTQGQDGNSFGSYIGLREAPQGPGEAKAKEREKAPATDTKDQQSAEGKGAERAQLHCPLCQEVLSGHLSLRLHLIHTHCVASDCVARLLAVAPTENHTLGASAHLCSVSAGIPRDALSVDPPPGTGSENKADTGSGSDTATLTLPNNPPGKGDVGPGVSLGSGAAAHPESGSPGPCSLCPPELTDLRCQSASPPEEAAAAAAPGLSVWPARGGPDFALDKFLDPTRPYKCSVCKESFSQRNILVVHLNSVSHLHKARKSSRASGLVARPPRSPPDKPFKCEACGVSYNQSSALDIHMRSVLHQTRTRAARAEAGLGTGEESPAPDPSSFPPPSADAALGLRQVPAPFPLLASALLPPMPLLPEPLAHLRSSLLCFGPPFATAPPPLPPPPPAPSAPAEPPCTLTRSFLASIGFELIVWYNESRWRQGGARRFGGDGPHCRVCSQPFSDGLCLRIHEEQAHGHLSSPEEMARHNALHPLPRGTGEEEEEEGPASPDPPPEGPGAIGDREAQLTDRTARFLQAWRLVRPSEGQQPQVSAPPPTATPEGRSLKRRRRMMMRRRRWRGGRHEEAANGEGKLEVLRPRNRRLQTAIGPEQLCMLRRRYARPPSLGRQALDHISRQVGLARRVVRVWFQNARAREHRGRLGQPGRAAGTRGLPLDRRGPQSEAWKQVEAQERAEAREEAEDWREDAPNPLPPPRGQARMSVPQLWALRAHYRRCRAPTGPECQRLAEELSLDGRVVRAWFRKARENNCGAACWRRRRARARWRRLRKADEEEVGRETEGAFSSPLATGSTSQALPGFAPLAKGLTSPNILGIAAPAVPPVQFPVPGAVPPWQEGEVPGDTEHRESEPLGDVDAATRAEAKTSVLQPPFGPGTQLLPCLLPGSNPLLVHPLPAAYLLPLCGQKKALLPLGPLLSPALLCLLPNVILQRGLQGVAQRQPRPRSPGPQGDPGYLGEGPPPALAAPCGLLRACGGPLPGYQALAVHVRPPSAAKDVPRGIPRLQASPPPDPGCGQTAGTGSVMP